MKFGHIDNGKLVFAKIPVKIGERDYFTEDASIMLQAGEKEIVHSSEPEPRSDGTYMSSWNETETQIVLTWTFVPYTDEELHKIYQQTVVKYIREKYTVNDENEILREYLAYGESKKSDFDEYNVYVESCKTRAYGEIYGDTPSA